MRILISITAITGFTLINCASERLQVTVIDDIGEPVSNATVNVGFSQSNTLFGGGHATHENGGHATAKTDTNGIAVVKFDCTTSDFGWHVEANGYYRGDSHKENFAFEEVFTSPISGRVILHEHEKSRTETLFKIKNPQPMFAHYPKERRKTPKSNGRYGFDLAEYDWLPPEGTGKVADFYLIKDSESIPDIGQYIFGRIEFDKDCGFYIGKQTGCQRFPATYNAKTNFSFQTNIILRCVRHKNGKGWTEPLPILSKDEYLVLRSRIRHDDDGNIISVNYSMVLGEFTAIPSVSAAKVIFNPRANDTNLEFDPLRTCIRARKAGA